MAKRTRLTGQKKQLISKALADERWLDLTVAQIAKKLSEIHGEDFDESWVRKNMTSNDLNNRTRRAAQRQVEERSASMGTASETKPESSPDLQDYEADVTAVASYQRQADPTDTSLGLGHSSEEFEQSVSPALTDNELSNFKGSDFYPLLKDATDKDVLANNLAALTDFGVSTINQYVYSDQHEETGVALPPRAEWELLDEFGDSITEDTPEIAYLRKMYASGKGVTLYSHSVEDIKNGRHSLAAPLVVKNVVELIGLRVEASV